MGAIGRYLCSQLCVGSVYVVSFVVSFIFVDFRSFLELCLHVQK